MRGRFGGPSFCSVLSVHTERSEMPEASIPAEQVRLILNLARR
ncbi:hypothetical protein LCGC14_2975330, partial [marine sediment metagenome]